MPIKMLLTVTVLVAGTAPSGASGPSNAQAERGEQLAQTWCSSCHAIGTQSQTQAFSDAPSFEALARRMLLDQGELAWALLAPHPLMPGFPLTQPEVRALSAYFAQLRQQDSLNSAPTGTITTLGSTSAETRGGEMAQQLCSECHAVAGAGPSPIADAPAFSTLSERYPVHYLEEALAEGILVTHPDVTMPEFVFEPNQINDLIAYLESIQTPDHAN